MNPREIVQLVRAASIVKKLEDQAKASPDGKIELEGTVYSSYFLQQLREDLDMLVVQP